MALTRIEIPSLFSSTAGRSNRAAQEAHDGVPASVETVRKLSRRLGLDFGDVDVVIVDDTEEVDYLDAQEACACTPVEKGGSEIRLGPAAFTDERTLAATLAHEYFHVEQLRSGITVSSGTLGGLEADAYRAEQEVLDRLDGGA